MKERILDAISGREFELAQRYCGLTPGQHRDKEHHQPCPFCNGHDRFRYDEKKKRFACRQCNFSGDLLALIMATNGIAFRKALELLATETGILLSERTKRTVPCGVKAAYERNVNDDRMTIASLTLHYLRFVPGTDGTDFRTVSVETIRTHARQLVNYPLEVIANLVATQKCNGDMQKAWIILDALYAGKDVNYEVRIYNFDKAISEIRWFSQKERMKLLQEVNNELERSQNGNTGRN
jgi:hypothetical protein